MRHFGLSRLHLRHAVKTGLACCLAYLISALLKSNYPVWAVVSTIVVMQRTSVAESLQASLLRFSGMALGAVIGVALSLVFTHPENIWSITVILFGLNAAGAYFFQYGSRYMLASIAATIVLLVGHFQMHHSMGEAVIFGLTLIWEIALGVGVAIVVSALIWPVRLSDTLKRDLEHQFSLVADHLTGIARAYAKDSSVATSSLRELVGKLLNNRSRLTAAAQNERYLYNENYDDLEARVVTVNRSVTVLRILLDVLNDADKSGHPPLMPREAEEAASHLALAITEFGRNGTVDSPGIKSQIDKAVAISRAAMEKLCKAEDKPATDLHGIMRAHSFFRLYTQLGGFYTARAMADLKDGLSNEW